MQRPPLQKVQDEYHRQAQKEQGGDELSGGSSFLQKKGQLFGSHSPADNSEDRQQRHNKHDIIKDKVRKCTCLQGMEQGFKRGEVTLENDLAGLTILCIEEVEVNLIRNPFRFLSHESLIILH
jgi:hypothetical protein